MTYHAGYSSTNSKCPMCNFQCSYQYKVLEMLGNYSLWDLDRQTFIPNANLLMAKIETGAIVVGEKEQFIHENNPNY